MQTGMNIGSSIDKEVVSTVTEALVKIMAASADQKTIRHAISAFGQIAKVENITIRDTSVVGDRKVTVNINADGDAAVHTLGEG